MTTDPRDSSRPSFSSVPVSDTGPVTLSVSVNGASREIPYGSTLGQLVTGLTSAPSGVAAAVNETVVPRGEWARLRLAEGDRVEVLTAVQGG